MDGVERARVASRHESFLITGARVYTGDPAAPWAEAVVTRGNRISYVGNEAEARLQGGTHTQVIHIPGGLVTAGLNDSHAHLNLAAYNLTTLNLEGATTLEMVQNMDATRERLEQFQRLHERGALTVRANHYMSVGESTPLDYLDECVACAHQYSDPWNHTTGIKMFIDGVVESKTALMMRPYADGSGDTGVPDMNPAVHRDISKAAHGLGLDVATHAIGDRGVHLVLDVYEAAQQAQNGRGDRRHRIEHIEVIQPSDIGRFAALGITASMQPLHAAPTTDPRYTPWTQLVGPEREGYGFAWRRLLETGAHLAFGSDWPVVTPDVRTGLHAALTRTDSTGEPQGGWQSQQCVTLAQALDGYTRQAAYAERQEHHKGTLRPGMLADITVFGGDLFSVPPMVYKWLRQRHSFWTACCTGRTNVVSVAFLLAFAAQTNPSSRPEHDSQHMRTW